VDDDEIEISLRDSADVARRAIVLASLLRRLALEDVDASDANDVIGEAFDLREWLRDEKLATALTAGEVAIVDRPPGALAAFERINASWQAEGLATLIWSLGLGPLPGVAAPADLETALTSIPSPWDETNPWVESARLLPEAHIAHERERAELWHWRANVEVLRRQTSPADRHVYNDAIRDVAAEALTAGLLDTLRDNDFAVGKTPFRSLAPSELDHILAATTERLRALNWISGFGASWDSVPLEV
jgi:hypothetical protein